MSLRDLTSEEKIINDAFSRFQEEYKIGFDNFLDLMTKQMLINEYQELHGGNKLVASCYAGCAASLRDASFAFYASTK